MLLSNENTILNVACLPSFSFARLILYAKFQSSTLAIGLRTGLYLAHPLVGFARLVDFIFLGILPCFLPPRLMMARATNKGHTFTATNSAAAETTLWRLGC